MTDHTSAPGRRRTVRRWIVALLAIALAVPLSFLAAGPASAHTRLLSSNPSYGAHLDVGPTQVVLNFDEVPQVKTVRAALSSDLTHVIALGQPVQNGSTVTVSWPAGQAPGLYTLEYQLISDDGDPVTGTLIFAYAKASEVQPAPSGTAATASGEPDADDTGRAPLALVWLIGVALVAFAALALLLVTRRRHEAIVDLRTGSDAGSRLRVEDRV